MMMSSGICAEHRLRNCRERAQRADL